jgi:transposase
MITNAQVVPPYNVFVGIDVDSKSYSFTIMNTETATTKSKKTSAHPHLFVKHLQERLPGARILCGYEAGGTGYALYDTLMAHNIECFVVSPNTIPKTAKDMVKNNRIDSLKLSEALHANRVHSIRVPTAEYRHLRHLIRIYDDHAEQQKKAKQRIKALLLFESVPMSDDLTRTRWSYRSIEALKHIALPMGAKERMQSLISDLQYGRTKLAETLRLIKQYCFTTPAIKEYMDCLISIPGIGIRVASYILGKIGDPQLLRNPQEIGSFFGIVPTEYSTGDTVARGSITHTGNAIARDLLVEAAWVAIRHDTELRQFYHRIKSRNSRQSGAPKAIVAVARKLTTRIYAVLKNKRFYEPR